MLKGLVDPANVFGVEIDLEIITKDPQILFCNVDSDRFPFPDTRFDFVISVWGMEHFQTEHLFEEAKRVLKPGGHFIFLTPNYANPIFITAKLFGPSFADFYYKRILKLAYEPHTAYYRFNRVGDLKRVANSVGLTLDHLTFLGPGPALWYARFSRVIQWVMRVVDFCLTLPIVCHLKPYLYVDLKKAPHTDI